MIAHGLCLMGGCFAQDAAGAAVETYWHAHSVAPQRDLAFSVEMLMVPCVSEDYWLFGRLEKISNINASQKGQMIFWGSWSHSIYHVFYLGCEAGAYAHFALGRIDGVIQSKTLHVTGSEPVRWEEVLVSNKEFVLSAELGQQSADLSDMLTFDPPVERWRARMSIRYSNGEVAAYAMRAPAGGIRFAILPLVSTLGNSAFFDVDNAELIEQ